MSDMRAPWGDVHVFMGSNGKAYYTPRYRNHENGPRSQGYVVHRENGAIDEPATLAAACKAAARDFPGLVQHVDTDTIDVDTAAPDDA